MRTEKMAKNKVEVKSKTKDGNDITVYVLRPDTETERQATIYSAKVFKDCLDSGNFYMRKRLNEKMREQGSWDDEKEERYKELREKIEKNLVKLKSGGIKLAEARKLAIEVRQWRFEVNLLLAEQRQFDAFTVEGQAENAKFDFLVASSIFDEEQKKVFSSIEEYQNSDEPFAAEAAATFGDLYYNLEKDWESKLPENQFLKKFGFVNEELRLVDKEGHLVDIEGNRIDESYRRVNEDGKLVDKDGNLLDEDGLPIVDAAPFLDDEGNPVE